MIREHLVIFCWKNLVTHHKYMYRQMWGFFKLSEQLHMSESIHLEINFSPVIAISLN